MTGAAWATTAVLLTAAAPLPLRAADWGATLTLASEYAFRGVSRTDGAAAQGGLHVQSAAGAFAGLWASNIEPQPAQIGRVEANVNAGWAFDLGADWSAALGWVRYLYPDAASPRSRFDWNEYSVSLNYADRLALTASLAPDAPVYYVYGNFGSVRATALEASWREPIVSGSWGSRGARRRARPLRRRRAIRRTVPRLEPRRRRRGGPVRHRARALRRQRRGAAAVRPRGGGPALDRVGDVALPSPLMTRVVRRHPLSKLRCARD